MVTAPSLNRKVAGMELMGGLGGGGQGTVTLSEETDVGGAGFAEHVDGNLLERLLWE